jgi:hypothetical protein
MTGNSKLPEDFDADALNADVLANKTDEQLAKLTDDIGTYESVANCTIMEQQAFVVALGELTDRIKAELAKRQS